MFSNSSTMMRCDKILKVMGYRRKM